MLAYIRCGRKGMLGIILKLPNQWMLRFNWLCKTFLVEYMDCQSLEVLVLQLIWQGIWVFCEDWYWLCRRDVRYLRNFTLMMLHLVQNLGFAWVSFWLFKLELSILEYMCEWVYWRVPCYGLWWSAWAWELGDDFCYGSMLLCVVFLMDADGSS